MMPHVGPRSFGFLFGLACMTLVSGRVHGQANDIDSLKEAYQAAPSDSARITLLAEIALAFAMPMPDSGQVYFHRALAMTDAALLSDSSNRYLRFARGNLLNYIAAYHINRGEISRGLGLLREALSIREEIGDSLGLAQSYNNLAMINFRAGRNVPAVELLHKSLRVSMAIRDSNAMAYNYNNIGQVWSSAREMEKAGEAFAKSLALRRSIGEKKALRESLTSMAQYHRQAQRPLDALGLLNEALVLAVGFGDSIGVSKTLEGLAHTMEAMDSLPQALAYTRRAMRINRELGLQELSSNNLMNMAGYVQRLGRPKEAINMALEGTTLAEQIGSAKNRRNGYALLTKLYKSNKDFATAYGYKAKFLDLRDSLGKLEDQQALVKTTMRFEHEQEFLADSLEHVMEEAKHKGERYFAQVVAKRQRSTALATAIGGALLLLLGGLAVALDHRRRKSLLARQTAQLQTQVWRAQINPRFIHTALQNINEYVQANERDLASSFLTRFARLMRAVLENARKDEVPLTADLAVLQDYLELEKVRTGDGFMYSIEVEPGIDVEEVMVPPMLLQPYAEQAIWSRLAKKSGIGHLVVRVQRRNGRLVLSLEDDGEGQGQVRSGSENPVGAEGVGITEARLALLSKQGGEEASVKKIALPQGQCVELLLPLSLAA